MADSAGEHPWQGVVIQASDLAVVETVKGTTVEECAEAAGEKYHFRREDLAAVNPVPLDEENVETLLIAALKHVFSEDPMLVISRERALFHTPDIVGVTATGRLSVVELKNRPARGPEILAQGVGYLVQCARHNLGMLNRWFESFYQNFPIFQSLYHLGLLKKTSAEGGIKDLLLERHPELEAVSESGGDAYFSRLAAAAEEYARENLGIDLTASHGPVLEQCTGGAPLSEGLVEAACRLFRHGPDAREAFREALNRDWRLVFFAPAFWFRGEVGKTKHKISEISKACAMMMQRGIDLNFLEYRVAEVRSGNDNAWMLLWRENPDWYEIIANTGRNASSAHKKTRARMIGSAFDRFRGRIMSLGVIMLKDPAYAWYVAYPITEKLGHFAVEYPLASKWPQWNFFDGYVRFRSDLCLEGQALPDGNAVEKMITAAQKVARSLDFDVVVNKHEIEDSNDPAIRWDAKNPPAPPESGDAAGLIVQAILKAWLETGNGRAASR